MTVLEALQVAACIERGRKLLHHDVIKLRAANFEAPAFARHLELREGPVDARIAQRVSGVRVNRNLANKQTKQAQ